MHTTPSHSPDQLDPGTKQFYVDAMVILDEAGVRYMVGGAYSLAQYAGIIRHTKDFDIFLRKSDLDRAINAFERAGCRTERVFPHWLAKVFHDNSDDFVDLIYSSGNGLGRVTDDWFDHAVEGEVLGRRAKLVPAEEIIFTKSFVQERERFDGADIAHLIWSVGPNLDWKRLEHHFRQHPHVLLAHLILFTYVYPDRKETVPGELLDRLYQRARSEPRTEEKLLRGTFISREQYLVDLRERGYQDARLEPRGPMTAADIAHWTAAIGTIK